MSDHPGKSFEGIVCYALSGRFSCCLMVIVFYIIYEFHDNRKPVSIFFVVGLIYSWYYTLLLLKPMCIKV